MRGLVSAALQLAGVVAVAYGCWSLAEWLGWIVGGLLVVLVGLALDPPARGPKDQPKLAGDVL